MDRGEALDALERAEAVGARVRSRSGSYMVYAVGYAALSFGFIAVLGLATAPWMWITASAVFGVAVTVLVVQQIRRPVTPRGFAWLHGSAMGAWGVLYGVTLVVGHLYFPRDPAWWLPAAAVCGLPLLVAGFVARHRSRSGSAA